jgi:hypothetical protein
MGTTKKNNNTYNKNNNTYNKNNKYKNDYQNNNNYNKGKFEKKDNPPINNKIEEIKELKIKNINTIFEFINEESYKQFKNIKENAKHNLNEVILQHKKQFINKNETFKNEIFKNILYIAGISSITIINEETIPDPIYINKNKKQNCNLIFKPLVSKYNDYLELQPFIYYYNGEDIEKILNSYLEFYSKELSNRIVNKDIEEEDDEKNEENQTLKDVLITEKGFILEPLINIEQLSVYYDANYNDLKTKKIFSKIEKVSIRDIIIAYNYQHLAKNEEDREKILKPKEIFNKIKLTKNKCIQDSIKTNVIFKKIGTKPKKTKNTKGINRTLSKN